MRRLVSVVVAAAATVLSLSVAPTASGAEADATPPVLNGASFSVDTATPGTTVNLSVDATDDVSVTRVTATVYEETSGKTETWRSVPGSDPLVVSGTTATSWANGSWRIHGVNLYDDAGNSAYYYASGMYRSSTTPTATTHEVDLKSPGFTLSGATDLSPPILHAFAIGAPALRAGLPTTFSWSVSDTASGVASLTTHWTGLDAQTTISPPAHTKPPANGSSTVSFPFAGTWEVSYVEVTDTKGNRALYQANGSLSRFSEGDGSALGASHDIDLAAAEVTLSPGATGATVIARPRRLTVSLPASQPHVNTLTGYRVTAQPSGITRTVPVAPTLARGLRQLVDLTGLSNGVAQTVSVTATSEWGESPVTTSSARPVLSSNVQGVADLDGDGRSDVVAQKQGGTSDDAAILLYRGNGAGGLRGAVTHVPDRTSSCASIGPFVSQRNKGMVLCQNDHLDALSSSHSGYTLGSRGWASMRFVDGGFDLNGDKTADVIAVDPQGQLRLYAQTSKGTLLAWPRIGTGWQSMISVVSAGDMNGDRRNDIAAVDAAGRLWLYPGNGKGGVTARRQIGAGWQNMAALVPLRDLSGDGKADLGGITPSGDLRLYRGTGSGGVRAGVVIGTGWQRYL